MSLSAISRSWKERTVERICRAVTPCGSSARRLQLSDLVMPPSRAGAETHPPVSGQPAAEAPGGSAACASPRNWPGQAVRRKRITLVGLRGAVKQHWEARSPEEIAPSVDRARQRDRARKRAWVSPRCFISTARPATVGSSAAARAGHQQPGRHRPDRRRWNRCRARNLQPAAVELLHGVAQGSRPKSTWHGWLRRETCARWLDSRGHG